MDYQKEFKKHLPEGIEFHDDSDLKLTDDEFVSVMAWIKFFKAYYSVFGKAEEMPKKLNRISKRIHLDFGFCNIPDKDGRLIIYLSRNRAQLKTTW